MLSNLANQNEEKSSDGPRKSESFKMDSMKLNIFFPKLKKVSLSQLIGTVIVNTFFSDGLLHLFLPECGECQDLVKRSNEKDFTLG